MIRKIFAMVIAAALVAPSFAQGLQRGNALQRLRSQRQQNGAANPLARQVPNAARPGPAAPADPGEVTMSGETSVMNMDGAALELVLKIYGELVKKTIIVDPAVQGTLNNTIKFKSAPGQTLTDDERIFAYETILEMNQIHLEPYGESFIRALPRKDVRKEGIPLIMDPETRLGESGKVVSMMINFKNIATDEAQKVLEGLKSNSGVLLVFERTNSILVTDTEQNINRMLEIARMVDVATPVTENVFVRQIKNASAQDIKTALEAIVQESQKELEKNGKQVPAATAPQPARMPSLLRRPGQPPQNQPTAPVNNESLVMSVSDADRGMIRGKVLILADERSNKLVIVTSKSNMDFFDKVIEQLDVETTPDTVVKVYRLKYAECEDVSDMINDLIGNAPSSTGSNKSNQNQNAKAGTGANITRNTPAQGAKKSANQRTGEAKTGELSKENTTVLADKRINGIVVMTNKELVPVLEQIIESMDIKLSQVLIETCIIEVALGHDLQSGIDWVQKGRKSTTKIGEKLTDSLGRQLYYPYAYDTETKQYSSTIVNYGGTPVLAGTEGASSVEALKNISAVARDGFLNYYTGGAYGMGGGASGGAEAFKVADFMRNATTNLLSKQFSFVFDSDELGLSAILHMAETDNRAKYIASPIVMTVDNKEATIDATENRQFVTGWTAQAGSYGNSGQPTPNYSAKDIGIKLKITPKINPNGTVMLNVEEEYSQLVPDGQSMLIPQIGGGYSSGTVDLARERKMSADVLLEDKQTVVFGGLTETATSEAEKGIPILKDIPWIGKWLFSETTQTEDRKELLVFLTPYVLNDAQAAQLEAMRRKKTMSDSRAWEDHGWSLSELADPVSKREQMRRIKDEAAKQDEERRTRIAIEKWKLDRAKRLKELSKEERDLWLKMHKGELEEEKQEELEKKMQDKDSQEELKRLAAQVREQKLAEAGSLLKQVAEETAAENERARLDREKAEKAEGEKPESEKPATAEGEKKE